MSSSNVGMLWRSRMIALLGSRMSMHATVLLWRGDNKGHPRRKFANGHFLDCVFSDKSQFLLLDLWSHVEGNVPVCNRDSRTDSAMCSLMCTPSSFPMPFVSPGYDFVDNVHEPQLMNCAETYQSAMNAFYHVESMTSNGGL